MPWKRMSRSLLITGFEEEGAITLEISPTMKSIRHGGHVYHRLPSSWTRSDDGTQGGVYLREDYGSRLFERLNQSDPP